MLGSFKLSAPPGLLINPFLENHESIPLRAFEPRQRWYQVLWMRMCTLKSWRGDSFSIWGHKTSQQTVFVVQLNVYSYP